MFKHCASLMLTLSFIACAPTAHAYIDPPYITPAAPVAGEAVSVNIGEGVCDLILAELEITQEGNAIRILLFGVRYEDPFMCNLPEGVFVYPVGTYPPGSYTLQVDLYYAGPGGVPTTETLAIVPFTVAAAPAPAVPTPVNGRFALALLMLALLGLAARRFRMRGSAWVLIAFLGAPLILRAEDARNPSVIEVLLTTAPGAPTPAQVVGYFDRSPRSGPLPLQSLSIGNPLEVQYLIPARAEGDVLAWLQANPDSPRAQLENYVVVLYPLGTDTTRALATLRSDPYLAAAYVPPPSWRGS